MPSSKKNNIKCWVPINKCIIQTVKPNIKSAEISLDLNDDLKFYKNKTKYVLFNILTNEYITINSELKNLRELVQFLIYSKYVWINPTTDEYFINMNNNIKNIYFA